MPHSLRQKRCLPNPGLRQAPELYLPRITARCLIWDAVGGQSVRRLDDALRYLSCMDVRDAEDERLFREDDFVVAEILKWFLAFRVIVSVGCVSSKRRNCAQITAIQAEGRNKWSSCPCWPVSKSESDPKHLPLNVDNAKFLRPCSLRNILM